MKGIDLRVLSRKLSADRMFNIIDTLFLDESIRDARDDEARSKGKSKLKDVYATIEWGSTDDIDVPHGYLEGDENGFPGLEAPMG